MSHSIALHHNKKRRLVSKLSNCLSSCPFVLLVIRRVRKEEDMVRRLTLTEAAVGVLLLAAVLLAAVQLGPTAVERWF